MAALIILNTMALTNGPNPTSIGHSLVLSDVQRQWMVQVVPGAPLSMRRQPFNNQQVNRIAMGRNYNSSCLGFEFLRRYCLSRTYER